MFRRISIGVRCFAAAATTFIAQLHVAAIEKEELIAPIRVPANARTWRDDAAVYRAWFENAWIKPFQQRSAKRPWSEEALSFVRDACEYMIPRPDSEPPPELFARARHLLEIPCTDPLVMYLGSKMTLLFVDRPGDQLFILEAAAKDAERLGMKSVAWFAFREVAQCYGNIPADHPLVKRGVELTKEVMSDGTFAPTDDQVFLTQATFWFGEFNKRYAADLVFLAEPSLLGEWLKLVFEGYREVNLAWRDRGGGYASSVTEEGWKGFREHLGKARQAATKAWALHPDRPDPAAIMMTVLLGLGEETPDETIRVWFDRAISARFDFAPAYESLLYSLKPQWGGSDRLMLAFGKACFATGRVDTVVPQYLFAAAAEVATSSHDWKPAYRGDPEVSRQIIELRQKLINEPTRSSHRAVNQAMLALDAYLTGDFELARKARAEVAGPLPRRFLDKLALLNIKDFDRELALTGQAGASEYGAAIARVKMHDLAGAIGILKNAIGSMSPQLRPRAEVRLRILELQSTFETGAWTRVVPAAASVEWFENGPNLFKSSDREYRPDYPRPPQKPPLHCVLPMDGNFECKWEMPLERTDAGDGILVRFFLAVRQPQDEPPFRASRWVTFQVETKTAGGPAVLSILDFVDRPLHPEMALLLKPNSKLCFGFTEDQVTLEVDGKQVFEGLPLPQRTYGHREVLIGFDRQTHSDVAIGKVEVRRMPITRRESPRKPAVSARLNLQKPAEGFRFAQAAKANVRTLSARN